MTANFPLFEVIRQEIKTENLQELTHDQQEQLVEKIKELDHEGNEIVLALIRNYQLEVDSCIFQELPYEAKVIKNGYRFFLHKLPKELVAMIEHFTLLHLEKQHAEKERNIFVLNK